jgi:hypothetical protein
VGLVTWDPIAAIQAELDARGWGPAEFAEALALEHGVTQAAASRRWYATRTGEYETSPEWLDRFLMTLDLHEPPPEVQVPGLDAWCPTCRGVQPSDQDGLCVWCDTQTGGNTRLLPRPAHPLAGMPTCMSEQLVQEARRLYLGGLSFRSVARELFPRSRAASANALRRSLFNLFHARGWATRDRATAASGALWKHGLARKGASTGEYARWWRAQRSRPCAGHRRCDGAPCRRVALAGGRYCLAHDPQRAAERAAHLARMRSLKVAA